VQRTVADTEDRPFEIVLSSGDLTLPPGVPVAMRLRVPHAYVHC